MLQKYIHFFFFFLIFFLKQKFVHLTNQFLNLSDPSNYFSVLSAVLNFLYVDGVFTKKAPLPSENSFNRVFIQDTGFEQDVVDRINHEQDSGST